MKNNDIRIQYILIILKTMFSRYIRRGLNSEVMALIKCSSFQGAIEYYFSRSEESINTVSHFLVNFTRLISKIFSYLDKQTQDSILADFFDELFVKIQTSEDHRFKTLDSRYTLMHSLKYILKHNNRQLANFDNVLYKLLNFIPPVQHPTKPRLLQKQT